MTAAAIIAELQNRGIQLTVDGDQLQFRAPRGALTPELRGAIGKCKAEIVSLLKATAIQTKRTPPTLQDLLEMGIAELGTLDVALEIRTELLNGTIWLVSNEGSKQYVDKPGAVYTAREAMLISGLPEDVVLQIHRFKARFDGTIEDVRPHTEGSK